MHQSGFAKGLLIRNSTEAIVSHSTKEGPVEMWRFAKLVLISADY